MIARQHLFQYQPPSFLFSFIAFFISSFLFHLLQLFLLPYSHSFLIFFSLYSFYRLISSIHSFSSHLRFFLLYFSSIPFFLYLIFQFFLTRKFFMFFLSSFHVLLGPSIFPFLSYFYPFCLSSWIDFFSQCICSSWPSSHFISSSCHPFLFSTFV